MYEIATLKTKKLPELQDIAKKIGIKGLAGLKKLDLIYQIVDFIASRPEEDTKTRTSKEKTTSGTEIKGQIKILPVQKSQPKPNQDNQQQKNNNPNQKKPGHHQNNNPNKNSISKKNDYQNKNRQDNNHNKDNRNRYRQPDFEFDGIVETEGVLEMMSEGYGFLRSSDYNYLSSPDDLYKIFLLLSSKHHSFINFVISSISTLFLSVKLLNSLKSL